MKFNLRILLITLVCLLLNCSEKEDQNNFTINGVFEGEDTKNIVLYYKNTNDEIVRDTIPIVEGKFSTKGKIINASLVTIRGNVKTDFFDDPNAVSFFLDATNIEIFLKENDFKKIVVKGSQTQLDNEKLSAAKETLNSKIIALANERNSLLAKVSEAQGSETINLRERIDGIQSQWESKLKEIKKIDLMFVKNNPHSYLSAFLTNIYFDKIPYDSISFYYQSLGASVQDSHYGRELNLKIEKTKTLSDVGNKAADFYVSGLDSLPISLESFKGKYVLLDFWASWCGPCREHTLELKALHEKYSPKGLNIIALSSDTDEISWRNAIQKDKTQFMYHGFMGKKNISISREYNVDMIPNYILIDKKGLIIERYFGSTKHVKKFADLEKKLIEIFS